MKEGELYAYNGYNGSLFWHKGEVYRLLARTEHDESVYYMFENYKGDIEPYWSTFKDEVYIDIFFTPSGVSKECWKTNEELKEKERMKKKALIQSNLSIPNPDGYTAVPNKELDKTKFGIFKDSEANQNHDNHDAVQNPEGYDKKISPIDYIEANGLNFCEGNVVKYITRHKEKNGAEDIKKAIQYCKFILKYQYSEE